MEAPPFDFLELSDGFWYDQPNFSRGCKDRGIQRHSFSGQKCVDYIGPMPQQRYQHGAVIPKGPRMVYAWMFLSPFFCLKQIKKNVSETFFHERTVRKLELKQIFELRFARECTKGWIRMEPVWNNGSTSFTSSTLAGFFNANNLQNNGRLQDCMVKGPEPLNHSTQHCVYDSSANGLPGNVVSGNMFSASLWFSLQFADHN